MKSGGDRTSCVEELYEPHLISVNYDLHYDRQFILGRSSQVILLNSTLDVIDFAVAFPAYD